MRFPLAEHEYEPFLTDRPYAKARLQELYEDARALFPEAFPGGYALYGFTAPSCKQQLRCRRLRLQETHDGCTVAPAFVMPSMSGRVADVEQAWFVLRFPGPCWAIADVFGPDARDWDRLPQGWGRVRIVGTTVKTAEHLPKDLVAEEKPRWWPGERVSIAPTAGQACLLGAAVSTSASQPDGQRADGGFATEAPALAAEYAPYTVNTDGWPAPPGAWQALFPTITVSWGFLHALLTIRDRATQAWREVCAQVQDRGWEASHAPSTGACSQRLRRLRAGAERGWPHAAMQTPPLDLWNQRAQCSQSDAHGSAPRPSKMVERLMKCLARAWVNAPDVHGPREAAESRGRALAWLWNFCPSSPRTVRKYQGQTCPAERLNGKR
jgi:hypothetical protein